MNSPLPPDSLSPVEQLARSRARSAWRTALYGLTALAIVTLAVLAAMDTRLAWPDLIRGAILLAGLALVVVAIRRARHRAREEHTILAAARVWEAAHPEAGQRIRTAIEVKRGIEAGEAHRFAGQLMDEAAGELARHRWQDLVPRASLWRWGALALLAFVGLVVLSCKWPDFRLGVARILAPGLAGTYTELSWLSFPKVFDEDHLPRIEVVVGRRPAVPRLQVRPHDGKWETVPLSPLPDGRTWDAVLTGYGSDLEVYAQAGDARTPMVTIPYRARPKVIGSAVTLEYPAYTGLPAETHAGGDIRAVEGTVAEWKFKFNVPPEAVSWEFGGEPPQSVEFDQTRTTATVRWTAVPGRYNAVLDVSDASGVVLDSWRYAVEGVKDELPAVEILDLPKKAQATPIAELPVRIRATDDFGVGEIGLILEVDGQRQWLLEKTFDELDRHVVSEVATVSLEKFPLTIRDNVRIYAYALDHKPRGGPRGVSPLRAIDIRDFRKLYRYRHSAGGLTPEEAEAVKDGLQNVEKLITAQRAVVSDTFVMREATRDAPVDAIADQAQATHTAEMKVSGDARSLLDGWNYDNDVPRDDVTLLSTAVDQTAEAARLLDVPAPDPAFTAADRALSTLLQLRDHLLTLILDGPSVAELPDDDDEDNTLPKDLSALAEEARRLAREEHDVGSQLTTESPASSELEATRRQQEIAVSDAGELYATMVDHPDMPEGAVKLMDGAERAMHDGDDALHQTSPGPAKSPLAQAEQRLNEVADFLRAMEIENASRTLRELAAKTDPKASSDAKGQGDTPEPENAGKSVSPSPAENKMAGATEAASPDGASASEEKEAHAANLTDDTLAAMAARAANEADDKNDSADAGGGDEPKKPGEENGGQTGNGTDGLASDLARVREESGIHDLARDASRLAGLQGQGHGSSKEAGDLRNKVAEQRAGVAKVFRDAATQMDAARAAEIAAARTEAEQLARQLADNASHPEKNGSSDSGDQRGKGGQRGKGDQGGKGDQAGSGQGAGEGPGKGNGGKGGGGREGDGEGGQKDQPGGHAAGGNTLGSEHRGILGDFSRALKRLNDKQLKYVVSQLHDELPPSEAIPLVQMAEKRLDEMLAALPGSAPALAVDGRIPDARRREIEDYFRNLSDDFGNEQWNTQPPSK